MNQGKLKIAWFIDGKLGDCILSCYSLLRLNLDLYEITVITSNQNKNLIKELKLPIKIIILEKTLLSFLSRPKIKDIRKVNLFFNFSKFDISINPFRWNSGSFF